MPLSDYHCTVCDAVQQDIPFRMAYGARASAPVCCSRPMEVVPAINVDVGGVKTAAFKAFTVHRLGPDGQQHEERIDSLHKLRQVERDSEQRYRNGEGEPLRFRAFSQDRSNMDENSFGTAGRIGERVYDSGAAPPKTGKVKVARHGQQAPKVTIAKGAGASPLPR